MVYLISIAVALVAAVRLDASLPETLLSGVAVWLIWRVIELQAAVASLQRLAEAPSEKAHEAERSLLPPQPRPASATRTAHAADEHPPRQSVEPVPTVITPAPAPLALPAEPPQPAWLSATWQRAREWLVGGNPAVRLGVVVLFFGVAFLLKLAAERSMLPIELRIAGVALGAIALFGLGWRLRARGSYGLVLQGGGIGGLYLTIFAALRLYELLPASLAFALLVALTAATALLAVRQNAVALAALAIAAGFLAPVLTSTGAGSHVVLFSYYALLNAGIFAISVVRAWRALNLIGFGFTFVIGSAWGVAYYRSELFWSVEPFLLLFFLFYFAISVLFARRRPLSPDAAVRLSRRQGYVDGTLVFGLPIIAFGLQAILMRPSPYGLALSAVGLGALYLIVARAIWRRDPALRLLAEAFLALGVVFTSLAIPLALDGRWTAAAWGLEGAALVWVGVRQHRLAARLFGLLLQLGACVALLGHAATEPGLPVFNGAFLSAMAQALAGLFAAWYLQRHRKQLRAWERRLRWLPFLWGAVWWYAAGFNELEQSLGRQYLLAGALLWCAATAVAATWLRPRLRFPQLQWLVQVLLPALVAAVLVRMTGDPLADFGWLGFPLAFLALYWTLRNEERYDLIGWHAPWHAVTLWTLAAWVSAVLAAASAKLAGAGPWQLLPWVLVPGLLALLATSPPAGAASRWPLAVHGDTYRGRGAGLLILAVGIWLLVVNLSSSGDPSPLPYLPLLNPVDIGSLFALMVMIRGWQTNRHRLPPPITSEHCVALVGALGFLWLNALLVRTVHHWLDVPLTRTAMFGSVELQAATALLWSALALTAMTLARRDGWRRCWFAGAALMGAVLIKLFSVDLDGGGTIARIVAFLGVGALLLIIGYLTPLPPAVDHPQNTSAS